MQIRLLIGDIRVYFKSFLSVKRVVTVTGVNSNVDDDTHFLMWDFDQIELQEVQVNLYMIQDLFNLPEIQIIKTGNGYHAYCWKACSIIEARGIIAFTPGVDRHYLAAGAGRGYFTLRFTDAGENSFTPVCTLPSEVPPDLSYKDVSCFVEYTRRRN